jgi:hypothetical protein
MVVSVLKTVEAFYRKSLQAFLIIVVCIILNACKPKGVRLETLIKYI